MRPVSALFSTRSRRAAALTAGVALVASGLAAAPALAAPGDATPPNPQELISSAGATLTAVPDVEFVPQTAESYMYSTMAKARTPLDLAAAGFVEEEYFLSGTANVYEETGKPGKAKVAEKGWEYTNNIIVRRPADAADASGVVLVDILNASNGYPGEDHWRRLYDWCLDTGCTYIGLTSKPIQIDSLHHFDAERYAPLSWDVPGAAPRTPITAGADFEPFQAIEGTEEGLVWDITTQLGNLLEQDPSAIIGEVDPDVTILAGQSQSGVYLNTYTTYFDAALDQVNDGPLWDAYLNSVGGTIIRELRQGDGGFVTVPNRELELSAPMITVDSEADWGLFGEEGLGAQPAQELRRHWQIPGSPHTWSASEVIPANEELLKAGRQARPEVTPEWLARQNPYPLEPAIVAAVEALDVWVRDGVPAAANGYFATEDGELVRDELGNAEGGVRYGLNRLPLARIDATTPADMQGTVEVFSRARFAQLYGTRAAYLERLGAELDKDIAAGYLTASGKALFLERAGWLLDRIEAGEGDGGADSGEIPVTAQIPGTDDEGTLPGGPGSLVLTVSDGGVVLDGARNAGDRLRLGGVLPDVSVTDTRGGEARWSVTGQSSDLVAGGDSAATVRAENLGWEPFVVDGDATPGARIMTRLAGGPGLATPATLGAGGQGKASLAADVSLEVPVDTRGGSYAGGMTVSLFPED